MTSVNGDGGSTTSHVHKPVIYDIEWYMLDKSKYYPYTILSSLTVRSVLYPLALVRTRLQIQVKNTYYRGTWDALKTVYKLEGFRALYRSFVIFNFHLVPSFIYITSYENIRFQLAAYEKLSNQYLRAMLAGGTSSLLSQALSVPIDVVVQHMMLVGLKSSGTTNGLVNEQDKRLDRIRVSKEAQGSTLRIFRDICTQIYRNDGISGFYRSYFLSTGLMSMNSALWWPIYYFYQDNARPLLPDELPPIVLQSMCAPMSSITSNIITNPLDVIRTRMQVMTYKPSFLVPFRLLTTISHIIISVILLLDRDPNIYGCGKQIALLNHSVKDAQLTAALSVMIALCVIELISLSLGISLYSTMQCSLCVVFHLSATISLLFFLFKRSCVDEIWPIFATCTCLPFLTEAFTIIKLKNGRSIQISRINILSTNR